MKKQFIAVALALALLAGAVAPAAGSVNAAPQVQTTARHHALFLDKTRFLAHMGVAYFAFHHFVWNPYKAGAFQSGAPGRTKAFIKAGVALLFAVHEVKVAYGIAKGSNSATLHAVISPVGKLSTAFATVGAKLKRGQYNPNDVTSLYSQTNSISKGVGGIKDISAPIPGT